MKRLTPKQQRFVAEYLVDLNGAQAAIRAGYSPKTAKEIAAENLTKPHVADAVAKAQEARAKRTETNADQVLLEVRRLALSDIGQAFDAEGRLLPIQEIPEELGVAISSFEVDEEWQGEGDKRRLVGRTTKIRLWDKVGALGMLLKHLGLLREEPRPVEVNTRLTLVNAIIQADIRERIADITRDLIEGVAVGGGVESAPLPGGPGLLHQSG